MLCILQFLHTLLNSKDRPVNAELRSKHRLGQPMLNCEQQLTAARLTSLAGSIAQQADCFVPPKCWDVQHPMPGQLLLATAAEMQAADSPTDCQPTRKASH